MCAKFTEVPVVSAGRTAFVKENKVIAPCAHKFVILRDCKKSGFLLQ